jgi:hypothetical protein
VESDYGYGYRYSYRHEEEEQVAPTSRRPGRSQSAVQS